MRQVRTNAVLVVDVVDLLHVESLLLVQRLFLFEYAFIEELLKFFVAIIYAKLFETVRLEIL